MAVFEDKTGRKWTLSLDGPLIRQIRRDFKLDLASLDGKPYRQLADDPMLLIDVLWVICQDQATALGLDDVAFGRSLDGNSFESATVALLEAITDFSPPQNRQLVIAAAERNQVIRQRGLEAALAKLHDPALELKALAAIEQAMDQQIEKLLMRLSSATNLPDSSESAPAV